LRPNEERVREIVGEVEEELFGVEDSQAVAAHHSGRGPFESLYVVLLNNI
jgi:hypothetical protein